MNNLKFRAYIKSINKVVDVLKIDFKSNTLLLDIDSDEMIPKSDYWWYETTLNFEDVELMQSTGLFDENGKEIFEGDIVNYGFCYFESNVASYEMGGKYVTGYKKAVLWESGKFVCDGYDLACICESVEVIGNIYENKELLRK